MRRSVSIVGAGRTGKALAAGLRKRGWRIGAVVTRSRAKSRNAVRAIGGGTPYDRLTSHIFECDVILLTTPDSALAPVARSLATIGKPACRGKIFLHVSGALSSSVLSPLARFGAITGSMHPMQTFTGRGTPDLKDIIFAVEGAPQARRAGEAIARALGGIPVAIDAQDKPAYHAAGALVAGHALALVEAATEILTRIGFPRRRAVQTLLPLMRQMLDNFQAFGPAASWTGPLARGDYSTVAKHVKALRKYPPEFGQSYTALARLAARVLSQDPRIQLRELSRIEKMSRGRR
jgi:predicted short-subunit dehydrogenase-like oxidoreductase (DUF2520 family)